MLEKGTLIDGKYEILSEIGHGGMSVVYMAINRKANKTWAVKEIRKNGTMNHNVVSQGLTTEIETLKKLSHPHMPDIVDVIDDDEDFLIIIMDYIQGRSLDKILEKEFAQKEEDVAKWAIQLCDVLNYLHSQKPPVIYRDMKPHNVMLMPNGDIKLIDFGTAKTYEANYGETTGLGTAGYAAPEQYIDRGLGRTDERTDIYCLGMTLYHLLTNVDPCRNIIKEKSIRKINPSLSVGLDLIIQKCTQELPEERYQSCAELMYDLEHYKDYEPILVKRKKRKLRAFLASFIMTVLCFVMGIGFGISASNKETGTYDNKIYEASKTTDYDEKITLYKECLEIPNMEGEIDAYLGLIQTFKEDDSNFSTDEVGILEKYIKRNQQSLQDDTDSYLELCYETGKMFWYYYNLEESDNQVTRTMKASEWFQDIVQSENKDYEFYATANAYYNIGKFHREITTAIKEADDKNKYKPMFDSMKELVDTVASNQEESEIVRLELIKLTRNSIQEYATKFRIDGVSESEITDLYHQLNSILNQLETYSDITSDEKKSIIKQMPDALNAIETAYAKKAGGNES